MSAATCAKTLIGGRRCGAVLDLATDGQGRVVATCPKCARTRRGLCRECPARVTGRARWCPTCVRARRRATEQRRLADPQRRKEKNAQWRERYHTDAAFRARRKAQRVAWVAANRDKLKRQKRRFLLREGPTREHYLATQRRLNADPARKAKKRAYALQRYYEAHPVRPDPHCAGCGVAIAWTPGRGRPRLTCDRCCSPAELRRRQSGRNTRAFRAARARERAQAGRQERAA